MEELVNNYKPDIIWSDGDWEVSDTYWNSTDFLAWLYNESPVKDTVIVNDRWGAGTSCKHGGFFNCADRFNPDKLFVHKWENCFTIDHASWGYRRNAQLADYQTINELIDNVVSTIAKGGNVLINVGPSKEGIINPIFEDRLLELGHWLGVNGEAIYESVPWKVQNDPLNKNLFYTTAASKHVYGILLVYPEKDDDVEFGAIDFAQVKSVSLLGYPQPTIPFVKADSGHVKVTIPKITPRMTVKYAWTFKFELN
jgi:alpha-L-fucosidase